MATQVYQETEMTLMDGTVIKMRPLKISLLREFMKKFEEIATVAEDNDKSMDVLIDCVQIAMKQYAPEYTDKDKVEENFDLPSVYKVIEAASGIKFDDEGNVAATGIRGLS
jgi:hypothetical protein